MELKKGLVHALTTAAFPLQILSWIFIFDSAGFVVPIVLSVVVHGLYILRVFVRGENQYRRHFFYYEAGVTIVQWVIFWVNVFFEYFPQFWIFIAPLIVQAINMICLFLYNRKCAVDGEMADRVDKESDERFKRGVMHALTLGAFPLQLTFCGYFFANMFQTPAPIGMIALGVFSIIAHVLYYERAIRQGQTQYKTPFFYFEVGMAIMQSFLLTADARTYNYYFRTEDIWLTGFPLVIQVIVCTSMFMESDTETDASEVEGEINVALDEAYNEIPSYHDSTARKNKNLPIEFAFPVVEKSNEFV